MSDVEMPEIEVKVTSPKTKEKDKSTPDDIDVKFTDWVESLWDGEERITKIEIFQLLGKAKSVVGERIYFRAIDATAPKPDRLAITGFANSLIGEMQVEADELKVERSYVVVASHPARGAIRRAKTVKPSSTALQYSGGRFVEEEGDRPDLYGTDTILRRMESMDTQRRFEQELQFRYTQLVIEENVSLRGHVGTMMGSWLQMAREKNAAENNALDREAYREDLKMKNALKKKGFSLIENLLGGWFGEKLLAAPGGQQQQPGQPKQQSQESKVIEKVLNDQKYPDDALTAAEKSIVFGDWSDAGECLKPGILHPPQVRILAAVLNDRCDPSEIDKLIPNTGSEGVTADQINAIKASSVDLDKFMPLFLLWQSREKLNKEAAKQQAAAS